MTESYAMWCSAGKHAFDPTDPDRHRTTVEDADGELIIIMTCGEHTPEILTRKSRKAIKIAETRID